MDEFMEQYGDLVLTAAAGAAFLGFLIAMIAKDGLFGKLLLEYESSICAMLPCQKGGIPW